MSNNIENRIASVQDIINIVELVHERHNYYQNLSSQIKSANEEARSLGNYSQTSYVDYHTKFTIEFVNKEVQSNDNDFNWFSTNLLNNAKVIDNVSIYFHASVDDKSEGITIQFYSNRIYFDSSIKNMDYNYLAGSIAKYIDALPPRLDELVIKDNRRKIIPALTKSIPLGIVFATIILLLCKFDVIKGNIGSILSNGIVLSIIFLVVAFLGSLLIPTKNHNLYRHITMETYYAGYDQNSNHAIYKNNYAEFKRHCEVAIGNNFDMPQVRKQIEENYLKAKKAVKIELIISVLAIILFFVFWWDVYI